MISRLFVVATAFTVLVVSGCAILEPIQTTTRYMWKSMAFNPGDQADWTDEEDPSWVVQAGEEARGDRQRQKDPDSWFRNNFMSEKARSIERNVGID